MRCRRRLPWVFIPALVLVLGGLLVMHGIDGSHATPGMSTATATPASATPASATPATATPAATPAAALGTTGPASSHHEGTAPEAGTAPAWSNQADHSIGDAATAGTGTVLGDVAMACLAVLFTVAASVGVGAALARVRSRLAGFSSAAVAIRRAVQTAWRPPAPPTCERCVLIC